MKIIIEAEPKEIAALAVEVRERQNPKSPEHYYNALAIAIAREQNRVAAVDAYYNKIMASGCRCASN